MQDTQKVTSKVMPFQPLLIINSLHGSYFKPFLMAEISACRELIFMHKARKHGLVPKFLIPKPLTFLIHCVLIRDIAVIVYSGM